MLLLLVIWEPQECIYLLVLKCLLMSYSDRRKTREKRKIQITPWKMRAYDLYSRVQWYRKTNEWVFLYNLTSEEKNLTKHFPWCNWFVYFINTEIVEKAILPCPVSTQEIVFPRWNCRKQNWSLAVGVFRFLGTSIFNSLPAAIRNLKSRLLFRQKIYEHFSFATFNREFLYVFQCTQFCLSIFFF